MPDLATRKILFKKSKNHCYMYNLKNCTHKIISPNINVPIAQACHIISSAKKGPRHNDTRPPDRATDSLDDEWNLIFLCNAHHVEIDHPQNNFKWPAHTLYELKNDHEEVGGNLIWDEFIKDDHPYRRIYGYMDLLESVENRSDIYVDWDTFVSDIENFKNLSKISIALLIKFIAKARLILSPGMTSSHRLGLKPSLLPETKWNEIELKQAYDELKHENFISGDDDEIDSRSAVLVALKLRCEQNKAALENYFKNWR